MTVVSSKRQITIPIKVCEKLKISPKDKVEFVEENGKYVMKKVDDDTSIVYNALMHLTDAGMVLESGIQTLDKLTDQQVKIVYEKIESEVGYFNSKELYKDSTDVQPLANQLITEFLDRLGILHNE